MKLKNIELPVEQIQEFCDRWHITEFALFGSILRDDFRPNSDVDVLVTFAPDAQRGLSETLQMKDELQSIFVSRNSATTSRNSLAGYRWNARHPCA
jgi:predicted nucleotidyltransferase